MKQSNPYELAARERKAHAIAMTLMAMTDRVTEKKIAKLRIASDELRAAAAWHARQKEPSAKTWARVIEILEAHERARKEAPADPFEGIGEDAYARVSR